MNMKEIEAEAHEKEQIWHSAATLHIKSLQNGLNLKNRLFEELSNKFSQLKQDFKYNLLLLQERDKELKDLDSIQKTMKANENQFLYDLSDLRIQLDNLKKKCVEEENSKKKIEATYKQLLNKQQTEFDIFRISKNKEVEDLANSFQKVKIHLEQENSQFKFQLEAQKLDMENELESLLKLKEKEQLEKTEENHSNLLVLEMKNKLLSKEVAAYQNKEIEHQKLIESKNAKIQAMQNEIQKFKWEMSDLSSTKNSRILELEAEIKNLKQSTNQFKKDFSDRKMKFDKEIRLKEANLLSSKQTLLDRERRFEEEIRTLKCKLETSDSEIKRVLWDKNNLEAELKEKLCKCTEDKEQLRKRLEIIEDEKRNSLYGKDVEISVLKSREGILKKENSELKINLELLRKKNVDSNKQTKSMVGADSQVNKQLQFENMESNRLESEKTQLQAELITLQNLQIQTKDRLIAAESLLQSRGLIDQYRNCLHESETASSALIEMSYAEKNQQLKNIIKQMSADMELLKEKKKQSLDTLPHHEYEDKYVKSLEEDLIQVKQELRRLKEDKVSSLHDASTKKKQPPVEVSSNHPKIQDYIQMLSNTIGRLEGEKVDLRAELQKLQANLDHQFKVGQEHERDARSALSKLQQHEVQFTSLKHRNEQEMKRLKDEISNLTLKLAESQQEADEYYRGGIQNNLRAMELSEQVSQLTVNMASETPWLSNHAQARLVQNLQDKVNSLQKQLLSERRYKHPTSSSDNSEIIQLRDKVRAITRENNMLLELSNKMRSKLNDIEAMKSKESLKESSSDNEIQTKVGDLEKLEELQYELTKKQLAFAQRRSPLQSKDSSSVYEAESEKDLSKPLKKSSVTPPVSSDHVMISSIDDSSIRDVWKILNHEPSSASNNESPAPTKLVPSNKKIPSRTTTKKKKKPKIRNYNFKD